VNVEVIALLNYWSICNEALDPHRGDSTNKNPNKDREKTVNANCLLSSDKL